MRAPPSIVFALIANCVETSDKALGILEAKMEPSDFAGWLGALSSLSAAQRCIVFRELALAEAVDPGEEGVEAGEPRSSVADAKRAEERCDAIAATLSASSERDIFRNIAKERYSRTGCPRCGGLDVRSWGEARGLPRYRCVECRKTFQSVHRRPGGRLAQQGSLARSGASPDRRGEPRQGGRALPDPREHRLPMAASVSRRPQPRQTQEPFGHRRGR